MSAQEIISPHACGCGKWRQGLQAFGRAEALRAFRGPVLNPAAWIHMLRISPNTRSLPGLRPEPGLCLQESRVGGRGAPCPAPPGRRRPTALSSQELGPTLPPARHSPPSPHLSPVCLSRTALLPSLSTNFLPWLAGHGACGHLTVTVTTPPPALRKPSPLLHFHCVLSGPRFISSGRGSAPWRQPLSPQAGTAGPHSVQAQGDTAGLQAGPFVPSGFAC